MQQTRNCAKNPIHLERYILLHRKINFSQCVGVLIVSLEWCTAKTHNDPCDFDLLTWNWYMTRCPLMGSICVTYEYNPWSVWKSMGVCCWPLKIGPKNDLEDIGQGQRSSHATHLMLVIICTIMERIHQELQCYRVYTIFKAKAKWPWRYRSRSKVIICNTPFHTSDHFC